MRSERGWNPWAELRRRPHLTLTWADLAPDGEGAWVPHDEGAEIVLDAGLGRRHRTAALAHELVHDERGIAYTSSTPAALVQVEERIVDRVTAARLVPLDQLQRLVDQRSSVGPVTTADVADEFDVTEEVARLALEMLKGRLRPTG